MQGAEKWSLLYSNYAKYLHFTGFRYHCVLENVDCLICTRFLHSHTVVLRPSEVMGLI